MINGDLRRGKQQLLQMTSITVVLMLGIFMASGCGDTLSKRKAHGSRVQQLCRQVRENRDRDEAMEILITMIDSNWSFGRTYAIGETGKLKGLARIAVPALMRAANSGDEFAEGEAVRALGMIGPEEHVREVVDLLILRVSEGGGLGGYAAEALGNLGPEAVRARSVLEKASALQSHDEIMSPLAKKALENLRQYWEQNENEKMKQEQSQLLSVVDYRRRMGDLSKADWIPSRIFRCLSRKVHPRS